MLAIPRRNRRRSILREPAALALCAGLLQAAPVAEVRAVAFAATAASPADAPPDDGIALTVSQGPLPGEVDLQWTGGQPTFEVFRSATPDNVIQPDHKLGETDDPRWLDGPAAGDILYYVVTGGLDRVPPTITATVTPSPNAAGWNNTDVQVVFACADAGSGIASCPPPAVVSAEAADQVVGGSATDLAGNTASASVTINLDRTPPVLDITEPAGTIAGNAAPTIRLDYADATSGIRIGTLRVSIDGVPLAGCSAGESSATCVPPNLVAGPHTAGSSLTDLAGNTALATQGFALVLATILDIQISAPADGLLTNLTSLEVSGAVSSQADSVVVNGVSAALQGGVFTAAAVPIAEGSNTITAVATNAAGDAGTASITVVRDTSAPTVVIESPAPGRIVPAPTVRLAGLVNDVVTGTVSARDCTVVVTNRAGSATASVDNRSFTVPDFPLVPGPNVLTARATDAAGNVSAPFQLLLTRQDLAGQGLRAASGDDQTGTAGSPLQQPLVVVLTSAAGGPVPGRPVTFRVSRGDGSLQSGAATGRSLTVQSDPAGRAQVLFTLGTRSGLGSQRVLASATGFAGEVEFAATAVPGPPADLKVFDFDTQRGVAGRRLPHPFIVFVHDPAGNPLPGVPVTFQVTAGGGNIDGFPSATVTTDEDGRAQITLTLGPDPGINNNIVQAAFPGQTVPPIALTASGLAIAAGSGTRVSGVVLDNTNVPVPGVTLRIPGTGLVALTDARGQFSIPGAPVATITLEVDGTTATRPGVWPMLRFELTTISGQDNTVGMPIYLLPIDTASGSVAGGPQDVTIPMADVPGVSLTVFANSVTCGDGSHQCLVSLSQVHNDRVPMPPLEGTAPRLIWTVQPAGTRFDPPARITYPNADGLPPGAVTEVLSFDHDLGQYVSVGTATVSEDGSSITSDPGAGIAHAGWGYPRPPLPPTTQARFEVCADSAQRSQEVADNIPAGDEIKLFANIQACIAIDVCDKATAGGFRDNRWARKVVPFFVNRWIFRAGDWNLVIAACRVETVVFAQRGIPELADDFCAAGMAAYHIKHDLRDALALPGIGCGDATDWAAVFRIVVDCVGANSARLALPDFAAATVGALRDSVRENCLAALEESSTP